MISPEAHQLDVEDEYIGTVEQALTETGERSTRAEKSAVNDCVYEILDRKRFEEVANESYNRNARDDIYKPLPAREWQQISSLEIYR